VPQWIWIVIVLLAGLGIAAALMITRAVPAPVERERPALLVETESVRRRPHRLDVTARGTVLPSRELLLQAQVAGRLVEVSENLEPGGFVAEGELLVRIDGEDYQLEAQNAESAVAEARALLMLEEGRQVVAREEWELFRQEADPQTVDARLALREPQLRQAQAALAAAESRLRRAELQLERTRIHAPFPAMVRAESAEIGQLVGPESRIAELVGSERFWILASLPVEQVQFVSVPGPHHAPASPVRIRQETGTGEIVRTGQVVRLLGDLSPEGLMARLLVEVPDPLGLADGRAPLLLNSFVRLEIEGRTVEDLIEVPRQALRQEERVFVFTEAGTLSIRQPEIAWRLPHSVLVRDGLEDGERLILSPMATPVEGMRLRTAAPP
jgi:RND family efflux transporter MFP subunit